MKKILFAMFLALATTASAAPFDGDAMKASDPFLDRCEQSFSSSLGSHNQSGTLLLSYRDVGQCMGACASEQGICISQCQGNGPCISNCAAAHGRCVSRCN